jgi:uncharacterized membrane protein YoaK (UPF0700 family)
MSMVWRHSLCVAHTPQHIDRVMWYLELRSCSVGSSLPSLCFDRSINHPTKYSLSLSLCVPPTDSYVSCCQYLVAVAAAGLYHHAITHISGITTSAAVNIINAKWHTTLTLVGDLIAWGGGAFLGALLTGNNKYHIGRHYAFGFLINSMCLLAATLLLLLVQQTSFDLSEWIVAFACGVQNGLTSNFSSNLFRTTHVTGMFNDTSMILAHWIRWGETKDMWRLKIFVPLFWSFFVGGFIGTVAWNHIGAAALFAPMVFSALFALVIFVLRTLPDQSSYEMIGMEEAGLGKSYGTTGPHQQ